MVAVSSAWHTRQGLGLVFQGLGLVFPFQGEADEGEHLTQTRGGGIQFPPLELHNVQVCVLASTYSVAPSAARTLRFFHHNPQAREG